MKTDFSANNSDNTMRGHFRNERGARFGFKLFIIPALLVAAAFSFSGCAQGNYASGYGPSYYAPDYGSYYADYGYAGDPYWGSGPYSGGEIIVGGTHHRSYYGGHHFTHESSGAGGRSASRAAGPSAAPAASAHGGGGGGHRP
jgi:predicted small secreted protein